MRTAQPTVILYGLESLSAHSLHLSSVDSCYCRERVSFQCKEVMGVTMSRVTW